MVRIPRFKAGGSATPRGFSPPPGPLLTGCTPSPSLLSSVAPSHRSSCHKGSHTRSPCLHRPPCVDFSGSLFRRNLGNRGPERAVDLMLAEKGSRTEPGLGSSPVASALSPWAPPSPPRPAHLQSRTQERRPQTVTIPEAPGATGTLPVCLSTPWQQPQEAMGKLRGSRSGAHLQAPQDPLSGPD